MKSLLAIVLVALSIPAHAQDFAEATILDFQSKTKIDTPASSRIFGGPAVEAEDYKEIVIALDGQKITARTFSMGNGLIFINNNPMAFAVGSKVEAKLGKRNELEVRVEGRRNPVKFAIQRVEIIQE